MYISMWVIAENLKEFHPDIDISDGKRILQNVRLSTKDLKLSPSTVYLFSLDENTVQCLNQNDVITFECNDIIMILNRILDLFEFYNNWENNLNALIDAGISSYQLLENLSNVLPFPMFLADDSYYIYEKYGKAPNKANDAYYEFVESEGMLPMEAIKEINQNPNVRKHTPDSYPIILSGGVRGVISRNLFCNDEREGWLVVLNASRKFHQGEQDILSEASILVERWLLKNQKADSRRNIGGLFLDILSEQQINWSTAIKRLQAFNWFSADNKCLYVFKPTFPDSQNFILDSYLKRIGDYGFSCVYEEILVLIVNCTMESIDKIDRFLLPLLKQCGFTAGRCQTFQNLEDLHSYFDVAKIAVAHPVSPDTLITDYSDALVPYSLKLLQSVSPTDLKHPSIDLLETYDKKHNSDFAETLRVFLDLERNYTDTAKHLNIHRSTLIYRIERITEMTGLDLENADLRFHLQLSFRL